VNQPPWVPIPTDPAGTRVGPVPVGDGRKLSHCDGGGFRRISAVVATFSFIYAETDADGSHDREGPSHSRLASGNGRL
jgi:hypothetical protein